VPTHSAVGPGRIGSLGTPRRRRAVIVATLALVMAGAGLAAVAGPGLAMRPVSSGERSSSSPGAESSPPSSAAAIAVALATAEATPGATPPADLTADPTASPTPGGHAPTPTPPARPVPCNAAATADAVRPCPPAPCREAATGSPTGAMAPDPCPPPPPPCMEPMASPSTPAQPVRDCPPPPCRWTMAGTDSVMAGPCPPPCTASAVAPSSTSPAPSYIRACPPWPGMVMLSERDSGRTVTVHAGTRILVRLSGGGVWTEPVTSDGTVVMRVSSTHDAQGDASGDFRAAHGGNANLTATDSPHCAPQCKVMSRLWVVHIVVVA